MNKTQTFPTAFYWLIPLIVGLTVAFFRNLSDHVHQAD